MDKIIKYKNLVKLEHKAYCDDCNVELRNMHLVITTYPEKYKYECPECGKKYTFYEYYPWEEIVGEKVDE